MSESLVVQAENEDAAPPGWDGAGVASSWSDLNKAVSADDVNPFEVVLAGVGAGLDTLDAVLKPLNSLATAGAGWLIEHIWWLHEPLDALAGDPTQIKAQAQTWHNVAAEMGKVAAEYRAETAALPGWEGTAGEAYRNAVGEFTAALERTSADAKQLSSLILVSGAGVGAVRSMIRDWIVDFVLDLLQKALAHLVTAFLTFGGSLAVFVVTVVLKALDLASDIARRVSDLLDALAAAGGTAEQLSDAIRHTAAQVKAATPGLRASGQAIVTSADDLHMDKLIETGKQLAGAGHDENGWRSPRPVQDR